MLKKYFHFAISIFAALLFSFNTESVSAQEEDRGTVKQPDYVAIPHPDEKNANQDDLSGMPNRSLANDENGDGLISLDEWEGTESDFTKLDTNEDGVLSARELESYIQVGIDRFAEQDVDHNGILTEDEWTGRKHLFRKLDRDKNGTLSRSEFYEEY